MTAAGKQMASRPRKSLGMRMDGARVLVMDAVRTRLSRWRQARSGDLLAVNIHCWEGMFVHLEWFLEISAHCERHGLRPCFMSSSPQYVDASRGPDWFGYFFSNPLLGPEDLARIRARRVPVCHIEHIGQLGLPLDYDRELDLATAPALVGKYMPVKPEVLARVDAFVAGRLGGRTALGVHYRGTDKRLEAPRLSYEAVMGAIREFLAEHPRFDCLFVSSDEQDFVETVQRSFGATLPVVFHEDQHRSRDARPVHHTRTGDGYRRAEEALLNCLLLSRCAALLKTPSILSGWSRLFNPSLPVTMLASPFDRHLFFPDRDLVRESQRRPADGGGAG